MSLNPLAILRGWTRLLTANILWLYVEFLAANAAATTLYFLLFPEQALGMATGTGPAIGLSLFLNPYTIIASLIFTAVAAGAVKRLWMRMGHDAAPGPFGAAWVPILGVSFLVDHLLTVGILFLLIPGLLLAALTTTLLPALVIERRGWGALSRACEMGQRSLLVLMFLWAGVLVPWLLILLGTAPPPAAPSATVTQIWVESLLSGLYDPAFAAVSLCLTMTVYAEMQRLEGPGDGGDVSDIFR